MIAPEPSDLARKTLLLVLIISALLSTVPVLLRAGTAGCTTEAELWIAALASSKSDILQNHAELKCEFSGGWMREYAETADENSRERMCTDLVLVWTHKECDYFRDYIEPLAYTPCKAWSRQMFNHCMANDISWFP
jgi:hypothetical protein